jgi:basic amino acid/polyamine antiporter, APA family
MNSQKSLPRGRLIRYASRSLRCSAVKAWSRSTDELSIMSEAIVAAKQKGVADESHGGFVRELRLFDSTMIVAGSMIGSGVFIVSADIARTVGSPAGLLAVWLITGLLTTVAALSYGELAGMFPQAGGQYVYLRETYSPLFGFLYGWTLFLVIQTGTIAAVGVAFAKFLGVLFPSVSPTAWIIKPINLSYSYAISFSWQQLIGVGIVVLLTAVNLRGIRTGKHVQNMFTSVKTLSLIAFILFGVTLGANRAAIQDNLHHFWNIGEVNTVKPDLSFLPTLAAGAGVMGLLVAICVSQVGSLFSSDAWNNITFTAAEVHQPERTVPKAMAAGTILVTVLYVLANVAYLMTIPLEKIKHAPDDRVATAALETVLGSTGAKVMAVAILISTFGCNNGLILAGARVYYAMAKDGLFFKSIGRLNVHRVPAMGLILQGVWAALLVLPRTRLRDAAGLPRIDVVSGQEVYGNLYSDLLDYVVFAVLIFYVLTIMGIFVLRKTRPHADRPYKAPGYPIVPAFYVVAATVIMVVLLLYKTQTTWPGLVIVLTGLPVYGLWRMSSSRTKGKA